MFFVLRRSCHMTSFFAEILRVNWCCTTHLPFLPKIHKLALFTLRSHHTPSFFATTWLPFSLQHRMARGQWYCLKRNPMCIFAHKRVSTWAPCEKHASTHASTPPSDCTAPAPFSPSLVQCPQTLDYTPRTWE